MIQQFHSWVYIWKKPKALIQKDTCTTMLIAALSTIAKTQKQPKCPSTGEFLFIFLETVYFPSTYFHFKSLWKNSLRPLSGCSYPLSGLSSESCRPVFSGRLSTPVFSGELLNRHRGHLHTFGPVPHLRLSSSERRSWSSPFTLKFLLGHSLLSCCLLFLFNLLQVNSINW